MTPKGGIRPHKLFQVSANRAEVLFVDYIAEHLNINGKAGIIIPEGIIFQTANAYKALRKMLMDENYLYAVVSLPAGVFRPYSGVKTSILFIDKMLAKKSDEILFVKVENDGFDLGAQRRRIDKNDLPHAFKILQNWQKGKKTESRIALWVKKEKIAENGDYNFTGDRYKEAIDYSKVKWPMVKLVKVITTITPPAKIKKEDFFKIGAFPVIDQSQNEIAGWTNNAGSLVKVEKPFVIFGDHTCAVKYVERPFAQGADGIKILKTVEKLFPKFLYFLLKTNPVKSDGYKRHFTKLKQIQIPLPPLEVQKEIVAELNSYQKVIDGARQVAENWKPRIKIDSDWLMVKLGEACDARDGTHDSPKYQDTGIPLITSKNLKTGKVDFGNVNYISKEDHENISKRSKVDNGDVLFAMIGTIGNPVIVSTDKIFSIKNVALFKFENNKKLINEYLKLLLNSKYTEDNLLVKSRGGTQKFVSLTDLRNFRIPLPPLEIQKQIVAKIEKEQNMVEECKKLITIHEQKIKVKIGEVWGE